MLNKKAQVSIEFLLIFVIVLVYIYSVVMPGIDISTEAVNDVSRTSQARLAAEKLANSINELLVSDAQAKKTIHLLVPENTVIGCDTTGGTVTFGVHLSEKLAGVTATDKCTERDCNGSIALSSANITCPVAGFQGKNFFTVELTKDATGTVNVG